MMKMADLIDRQQAIDACMREDVRTGYDGACLIAQLPSAQPEMHDKRTETHSCDCISRQAAIDTHYEYCNKHPDASFPVWSLKILEDLPSAQPEVLACGSGELVQESDGLVKDLVKESISRQQAIDAINALHEKPNAWLDSAVDAVMSLPSAQPQWIPCSERLPKEKDAGILKKLGTGKRSEYVLATVEVKGERMTVTACTYDGKWDWNMKYAFPTFKVVAWMPLPEPYGGESE